MADFSPFVKQRTAERNCVRDFSHSCKPTLDEWVRTGFNSSFEEKEWWRESSQLWCRLWLLVHMPMEQEAHGRQEARLCYSLKVHPTVCTSSNEVLSLKSPQPFKTGHRWESCVQTYKGDKKNQGWWHTTLIPVFKRQRQAYLWVPGP